MTPFWLILTLLGPHALIADTVSLGPMTQAECGALEPELVAIGLYGLMTTIWILSAKASASASAFSTPSTPVAT